MSLINFIFIVLIVILSQRFSQREKFEAIIKLAELNFSDTKWLEKACEFDDTMSVCSIKLRVCLCPLPNISCNTCCNFDSSGKNVSIVRVNSNAVGLLRNTNATLTIENNQVEYRTEINLSTVPNNKHLSTAVNTFRATTGRFGTTLSWKGRKWSCVTIVKRQPIDNYASDQKTSAGVIVLGALGASFCFLLIFGICRWTRKPVATANVVSKTLADFAPTQPPMIPVALVDLVKEIEERGLDSVGLYRMSGPETEVTGLMQHFATRSDAPNLDQVSDINVLACCIKKFLQQLSEPLIPSTSWHQFAQAVNASDSDLLLHQAISALPSPNRHTLAFLILHLLRVAENSDKNKMTIENLAKIFGPTIVGYSSPVVTLEQGIEETKQQEAIVKSILAVMTPDYWINCLCTLKSVNETATFVY